MSTALRFWARIGVWTGILLVILLSITLLGGGTANDTFANVGVWAGLALVLSAYPAGISVASSVIEEETLELRPLVGFGAAVGVLALLAFVLFGYLGPALVRAWSPGLSGPLGGPDPNVMSLSDLLGSARVAAEQADQANIAGASTAETWLEANVLVWHFVRRLAGVFQPVMFATIGLLAGFWARRAARRDLEHLQYWALGFFLVVTTYLAGENSYELIVLQANGPAFFAGWFVLMVPTILVIGIGWPTVLTLWRAYEDRPG